MVELSSSEILLLLEILHRDVEYGHPIPKTKKLIGLFDKLQNQLKENSINE